MKMIRDRSIVTLADCRLIRTYIYIYDPLTCASFNDLE